MEITESKLTSIMEEIKDKMWDIPFGQSLFQTEKFIMGQYKTNGRLLRQAALELNNKITVVQKRAIAIEKTNIDIEELRAKLNPDSQHYEKNEFERRRLELELKEKTTESYLADKLLNDVKKEFEYIYSVFKKLPKMTREEFEKEEEDYYLFHLEKQIKGMSGAHESLYQMGMAMDANSGEFIKLDKKEHGMAIDRLEQELLE